MPFFKISIQIKSSVSRAQETFAHGVTLKDVAQSAAASDSVATSDQVLVEPVSFTFDTIELGSISCAGFLP